VVEGSDLSRTRRLVDDEDRAPCCLQVIDTFAIWFEVAEHCAKLEAEPFPWVERRELGCVDWVRDGSFLRLK
jgi:hypothetical protein